MYYDLTISKLSMIFINNTEIISKIISENIFYKLLIKILMNRLFLHLTPNLNIYKKIIF